MITREWVFEHRSKEPLVLIAGVPERPNGSGLGFKKKPDGLVPTKVQILTPAKFI